MIKLIVGLGNPGQQYERNRHNVGFLFLDYLFELAGDSCKWVFDSKYNGVLVKSHFVGKNVILLKPQTYMNRSGFSVGTLSRFYKLDVDEILVVHDELDLSAGDVRLKTGGGHAGHNGLRDIISNLGDRDFHRIRIGIGRPSAGKKVSDYVLSNPSKVDLKIICDGFDLLIGQLDNILAGNVSQAMNVVNR